MRTAGLGAELTKVKAELKGPDEVSEKDVSGANHLWLWDVPIAKSGDNKGNRLEGSCYWDKIPKAWIEKWRDREIKRSDWRPSKPHKYDQRFKDFVDTHIPQFNGLGVYEEFYLYCEQARRWLEDKRTLTDIPSIERADWKQEELRRIADNKLYGLEKYCTIKEDGFAGGRRPFKASAPHAFVAFLVDRGNHFDAVKGRQAAFTSMMLAIADLEMITKSSYTGVFMVHKKDGTGKTLFRDKHQSTLQHFPQWISREIDVSKGFSSESTIIDFDPGDTKATKGMDISEFRLLSAEDTMAVNGRTPTQSFVDEAQNVPTYQKVKAEIAPTLYQFNLDTGEYDLVRQIFAWGCVCAGTKVWTSDGRLLNVEDLQQSDGIMGWSSEKGIVPQDITYIQPPSEKPCYRITTNTGRYLECSEDHPILWSTHGWNGGSYRKTGYGGKYTSAAGKKAKFVEAKDISAGDQVAVADSIPFFGSKKMWEPRLVGWLIGDGYYGGSSVRLSNCDSEINEYVYSNFDAKEEKGHTTKDGKSYRETRVNGIQDRLREIGIFGQTKLNKRLPDSIHDYCKEDICELLGGLFDTDGNVNTVGAKSNRYVALTSSCYEMLDEVRLLLQKIGVQSNVTRIKCNPVTNPRDKNDWFSLTVATRDSVIAFRDQVKFFIGYKQSKLDEAAEWHGKKKPRHLKNPHGTRFERVVSAEYIGIREIYNLTASSDNTYLANGIITHNTGSSNNTGQGAFENDFKGILESWQGGEDTAGWVPVFFDWTCRPGMTRGFYEDRKKEYLRGQTEETKGLTPAERLSLFYAHYPSKPDDAFMSTHKTLIPMEMIVRQQQRISEHCTKAGFAPEVGKMEPIYNESIEIHGELPFPGLKPHPIVGARWVPSSADDFEAPIKMFMPPQRNVANNCFQGTDPIANDGGFSRFSSAIWMASAKTEGSGDNIVHIPTVACMLNARTVFPHELFLQCALMGIYYANYGQKACKELVEINVGTRYTDFKCGPWLGLRESLLTRHQLPPAYKRGQATNTYGIDLKGGKGSRKEDLYGDVTSLLRNWGHNIWYYDFWSQVRHISVESKEDGSVQWKTQNKNVYNDDMVYAVAYAELCCRAVNKMPELVSIDTPKYTTKRVVVRDQNMNPHYQYVQVPATYA